MNAPDYLARLRELSKKSAQGRNCINPVKGFTRFVQFAPGVQKTAVSGLGKVDIPAEPFDREAWEERAAIVEFDGGLSRADAEALAWEEDARRRTRAAQAANTTHRARTRARAMNDRKGGRK